MRDKKLKELANQEWGNISKIGEAAFCDGFKKGMQYQQDQEDEDIEEMVLNNKKIKSITFNRETEKYTIIYEDCTIENPMSKSLLIDFLKYA